MVATKLDHSGVLVTKFRQNRSTLKVRSASQRHTHRHTDSQTNSAENNGPSGLQSGQYKINNFTILRLASYTEEIKIDVVPTYTQKFSVVIPLRSPTT